eukprot:gene2658-2074_t
MENGRCESVNMGFNTAMETVNQTKFGSFSIAASPASPSPAASKQSFSTPKPHLMYDSDDEKGDLPGRYVEERTELLAVVQRGLGQKIDLSLIAEDSVTISSHRQEGERASVPALTEGFRMRSSGQPWAGCHCPCIGDVSDEDMQLLRYVTVKDMTKIFNDMGESKDTQIIWRDLKAELRKRKEDKAVKRKKKEDQLKEMTE